MGSRSTTTSKADPWGPAQPFMQQALQGAGDLYASGGFQVNPYGGQMVAGFDPMQQQAMGAAPGVAGLGLAQAGTGMGAVNAAMDPNQQSAQFGQVVQNTINRIMPQINSSFAGSGMTGSGLHAQNLGQGVSAGVADTLNQNWQQGQNRALQAAGMVPGLNQAAFGAVDFLNQFGQQGQQQNQAQINAEILRNQQAQQAPIQAIQDYAALVGGIGGMGQSQTQTQSQSPGLLGIAGLGLQALPLLLSDKRTKTDIEKVGKTDSGHNVYTYRYRGNPTVHMGVMAQEVQKKKPDAVHDIGGILAVDYGAL